MAGKTEKHGPFPGGRVLYHNAGTATRIVTTPSNPNGLTYRLIRTERRGFWAVEVQLVGGRFGNAKYIRGADFPDVIFPPSAAASASALWALATCLHSGEVAGAHPPPEDVAFLQKVVAAATTRVTKPMAGGKAEPQPSPAPGPT